MNKDRHESVTRRSQRLYSNELSNILIYLTGHGGNEFLKFNDIEEILDKVPNLLK